MTLHNILGISFALWVLLVAFCVFKCSDRVNVFVRRHVFGATVIHIRGVSSAIAGTSWSAILERDPWGDPIAYRFPAGRIGAVKLNGDGTGEYCGKVEWIHDAFNRRTKRSEP